MSEIYKQWEKSITEECLHKRNHRLETLKTKADIINWQKDLKAWFRKSVGPLVEIKKPKKILKGTLSFDQLKIEKWMYEVFPGTYAAANFYIPNKMNEEGLVILAPIGHWKEGKTNCDYQNMAWFMALHGIPVLVYEHAGLGERREYWDPARAVDLLGKSPTCEHCRMGDLAILAGIQSSNYFLSEVRQSLNFLYTFPFVKKGKVGITGASGGGSMSREAACYFDELAFSVPVCILRGGQVILGACHEQITWGEGLKGVSASDYLTAMVPKPVMMVTEFLEDGSAESFSLLKAVYKKAGASEKSCGYFAIKDVHGYTHPMIEAVYRFLSQNFHLPKLNPNVWQKAQVLGNELWVTECGFMNREVHQVSMAKQIAKRIATKPKGLDVKKLAEIIKLSVFNEVPPVIEKSKIENEIILGCGAKDNISLVEWEGFKPGYFEGYGHVYSNNEPSAGRWFLSLGGTLIGFWVKQILNYAEKKQIKTWHAEGKFAIPVLIAAAIGGKKLFPEVKVNKLLKDYRQLLEADLNLVECGGYIPGLLNYGDIDDIISLVKGKCVVGARIDGFERVIGVGKNS